MTARGGEKAELIGRLQELRESVLWKLEDLSEYDLRRPVTPTGTNLLGLVKHLAGCEFGYFGEVFGRPAPVDLPWTAPGSVENADMWATPDESVEYIVDGLYRRAWRHAAETFEIVELDDTRIVPGWPAEPVTLHRILVHMNIETARHAGHMDIVRELIDGAAGMTKGNENLPYGDAAGWQAHHDEVARAAEPFA